MVKNWLIDISIKLHWLHLITNQHLHNFQYLGGLQELQLSYVQTIYTINRGQLQLTGDCTTIYMCFTCIINIGWELELKQYLKSKIMCNYN